eukprot:841104-Amorphochlora_amoeboformis.AAC.1
MDGWLMMVDGSSLSLVYVYSTYPVTRVLRPKSAHCPPDYSTRMNIIILLTATTGWTCALKYCAIANDASSVATVLYSVVRHSNFMCGYYRVTLVH